MDLSFAFLGMFTLCEETYAFPGNDTQLLSNATMDTKEFNKEAFDKTIKETATASKDVKDAIKVAKETKKSKKDCARDCGTDYDPVCVHDPADSSFKPRTFGSPCALDVQNCEMGTKLAVKSKGECPGSGGVRLS
ncbi:hypothetical protein PUN28_009713 [Cardiocondyla obscurior]|uniref:Kazal-like domain-containing protein n=1 Tax=Cardiocondyla obscurior TaxID=286306 RepID=A0AAW2FU70_9HYME